MLLPASPEQHPNGLLALRGQPCLSSTRPSPNSPVQANAASKLMISRDAFQPKQVCVGLYNKVVI